MKGVDFEQITIFGQHQPYKPMTPKLSRASVFLTLSASLVIAIFFTYLIFRPEDSLQTTAYILIAVLTVLVVIALFMRYLPGKIKEKVERKSQFFRFLDLITHELIPNRISLIIIALLFGLFSGMEQAEELLLHLSQNKWSPPIFFSILMILALLSWYWTRFMYMYNIKDFKLKVLFLEKFKANLIHQDPDVQHVRGMLPKLLGLIIILIPTFFILKLYLSNVAENRQFFVILGTGLMFWVLMIIGYAFAKVSFYEFIKEWLTARKWMIVTLMGGALALTILLFFQSGLNSPKKIPLLYFSGLVISIIYFLIASLEIEKMFFLGKKKTPLVNRINTLIFIGAVLVSILFILFNIIPLYFNLNGLTILLAGLVFYSFLAYFMIVLGGKINIPVLSLLMTIGTIITFSISPKSALHDVRLTEQASDYNINKRVDIDTYIAKWLEQNAAERQEYADQGKPYPVIFISAEGGGSRAALWTLLVHDTLENTIPDYYNHIFAMSGASGGNTGNSFYMAFQEIRTDAYNLSQMADNVFKNDFVSTDIGLLFGRDAWQSMTGLSIFSDRSEILQQKWENKFGAAQTLGYSNDINPLKRDFMSFWYNPAESNMIKALEFKHPLFLLNTTHIQSGDHATLSAVQLENFIPQNMDLLESVYNEPNLKKKSVPLSSGTLMNARFPIVCPSGKIPNIGNFVDAGYFDNTGGAETRAAILALRKYIAKDSALNQANFNFIHLAFRNGLPNKDLESYTAVRTNIPGEKQEPYSSSKGKAEALVPIVGLAGAAFAHPNKELAEIEYVVNKAFYFDLKRMAIPLSAADSSTVTPILPLSRHLSKLAIRSMHTCIDSLMDNTMINSLQTNFILN